MLPSLGAPTLDVLVHVAPEGRDCLYDGRVYTRLCLQSGCCTSESSRFVLTRSTVNGKEVTVLQRVTLTFLLLLVVRSRVYDKSTYDLDISTRILASSDEVVRWNFITYGSLAQMDHLKSFEEILNSSFKLEIESQLIYIYRIRHRFQHGQDKIHDGRKKRIIKKIWCDSLFVYQVVPRNKQATAGKATRLTNKTKIHYGLLKEPDFHIAVRKGGRFCGIQINRRKRRILCCPSEQSGNEKFSRSNEIRGVDLDIPYIITSFRHFSLPQVAKYPARFGCDHHVGFSPGSLLYFGREVENEVTQSRTPKQQIGDIENIRRLSGVASNEETSPTTPK
uniref:Uncharacterized protein n=1 Tax=Strigamia maritima TaxID=126957 RepID=T1II98_STRMM